MRLASCVMRQDRRKMQGYKDLEIYQTANPRPTTHDPRRKGQSILEYALIISVVVAALAAMSIYVQRSAQANLKVIEDQINAQSNN